MHHYFGCRVSTKNKPKLNSYLAAQSFFANMPYVLYLGHCLFHSWLCLRDIKDARGEGHSATDILLHMQSHLSIRLL